MKNLLYIFLFVPIALFGQENYSLSFDGVDDYVDITSSSNYPSNIGTISVSFKLDNAHISQTYDLPLFMIDNGLSDPIVIRVGQCLCDAPGASLSFSNDDCGGSSPEVKAYWGNDTTYLYDGNWHNITLVVGDDYHEIYLDGSKLELIYTIGNELVGSFLYGAETELFYFGKRDLDNYSSFFQGYMDNIQLWDRPLNANEIRQYIFETPPLGNEFGFQSAWNFNQGEGEYVSDISINENLAILQGPVYLMTESNFILGCTDELFIEFNSEAGINDGSCQITWQEQSYIDMFDSLQVELNEINNSSIIALSSLQQALDTWNTTIDLSAGWNMFGYGCPTSIDLAEGLYNHTESVVIVKDNNGSVYMPEFGFNGIGDFTPGFGYQIKLTEAIEGFSLCDWYVNDIPEDNILSLQDSIINMHNTNCVEDGYCGYDVIFSNCFNPNEGFDCEGNEEIEYSLSFDEVDDMVSCGSTIDISSSFSIAAWVYALPNMANYTIASKREMHQNGGDYYNGFHLTLENDELGSGDDGLRFVLHNNSQGDINKAIAPLNFNQWNYVVGVFDSGSSIKLYINGELVDNAPTSLTSIGALSSTADFLIGAAGNYPTFPVGNYINGNLEDVSLWDIPLTQQEINDCMNCPLTGVEEGLVGYWNFNEGEGNTVYDISGNGNHGAINGGAIFSIDVPENICE